MTTIRPLCRRNRYEMRSPTTRSGRPFRPLITLHKRIRESLSHSMLRAPQRPGISLWIFAHPLERPGLSFSLTVKPNSASFASFTKESRRLDPFEQITWTIVCIHY
jgi:hypothetical protein